MKGMSGGGGREGGMKRGIDEGWTGSERQSGGGKEE